MLKYDAKKFNSTLKVCRLTINKVVKLSVYEDFGCRNSSYLIKTVRSFKGVR